MYNYVQLIHRHPQLYQAVTVESEAVVTCHGTQKHKFRPRHLLSHRSKDPAKQTAQG